MERYAGRQVGIGFCVEAVKLKTKKEKPVESKRSTLFVCMAFVCGCEKQEFMVN